MSKTSANDFERDFAEAVHAMDAPRLRDIAKSLIERDPMSTYAEVVDALLSVISGDIEVALKRAEELIRRTASSDDRSLIGWAQSILGVVYWMSGEYEDSLSCQLEATLKFEATNNALGLAFVNVRLGGLYSELAQYEDAIKVCKRAIELFEREEYDAGIAGALVNLAGVYIELDDGEKALELLHRSYDLFVVAGSARGMTNVKGNIGTAHIEMENYETSVPYLKEAVDLALQHKLSRESGFFINSLAFAYYRLGRLDEAWDLLDRYSSIIEQNPAPVTYAMGTRAMIIAERGDHEQGIEMMRKAMIEFGERNERYDVLRFTGYLREIAKNCGNFELYVETNEDCLRLERELQGAKASRRIATQDREDAVDVERRANERERTILYSTLPRHVADRLVKGEEVTDHFDVSSVLFLDVVGFTTISDRIPAGHVVHLLKAIFKICDEVCDKHGVTKIKTIGDSYLAVSGVPEPLANHAERAALAALDMMKGLNELQLTMAPSLGDTSWTKEVGEISVRIGLHSGPIVAGIVGDDRLQYDVWGDTVNVASRMESSGEAGKVHASEAFSLALRNDDGTWRHPETSVRERGTLEIKGKGTMTTYWLEGA